MKALVTCEITDEFLKALHSRNIEVLFAGWGQNGMTLGQDAIKELANDCQIVVVEIEELNADLLDGLKELAFVGVTRGNPVNVDLEYCAKRGIKVVSTPGRNADSVADYCLAKMLDLSRRLTESSRHLIQEGWMYRGKLPYLQFRGRELRNQVIGLYGMGQVGIKVAERVSRGFGSEVLYFDPYVTQSPFAQRVSTIEELFDRSDVISLHAPVLPTTKNSVNRDLLRRLGPNGILVNSARAALVLEEDLYQALVHREIGSAALDVFWEEPLELTSRWLQLEHVICTPHIAGAALDVVANHCNTILKGIDEWILNSKDNGGEK